MKLCDRRLVDEWFERRVATLASLSELTTSVVGPVSIGPNLVTPFGGWNVVAFPLVRGEPLDLDDDRSVSELASALVVLHRALDRLGSVDLPAVAALRTEQGSVRGSRGGSQLLHGDFSSANVLRVGERLRVFDFDDVGYGPVAFEIGNTLYMVLFDAWRHADVARYERFRERFVATYRSESGRSVGDDAVDAAIDTRARALARWVSEPDGAPIGIRTSSTAWRATLQSFVRWFLDA